MTISMLTGDCRDVLPTLPAGIFHTCVTSPPYFGLRDYGVDGQIGLEPTPDEFVAELVKVFREVRRVLRDDGTVWLNLGDSYNSQPAGNKTPSGFSQTRPSRRRHGHGDETVDLPKKQTGLKPKDLIGIPWRVAFALQADGWYLRQDIIWAKPNPMPESVTDRCTKAHEYLFLLTKRPRYYFDAKAIAEPLAKASVSRLAQNIDGQAGSGRVPGKTNGAMKAVSGTYSEDSGRNDGGTHPSGGYVTGTGLRNRRSVWAVTTQPFSQAHFATFPPKLIEPCILAGCPKGGNVLDPFGGAGTTGMVSYRTRRNATMIDLNPEYIALAKKRIADDRIRIIEGCFK